MTKLFCDDCTCEIKHPGSVSDGWPIYLREGRRIHARAYRGGSTKTLDLCRDCLAAWLRRAATELEKT